MKKLRYFFVFFITFFSVVNPFYSALYKASTVQEFVFEKSFEDAHNLTEALASTYILISTEGSFLSEISAEYGNNSWQYQTASKVNTFFEVYLLCRFGYAALGPLRSLALEIKNISASDVSFFQNNYPKFYERLLSVRNKAGEVLSGGSGVGKYWRTAVEMRDDVMNWAKAYQSKLPTPTQLDKFSKATAASYRKADGTIETVFGRNGGVLNKQSSYPTISAEKNLSLHKDLADRLPTSTQWPNTANCAECDAVNQALHNGAKWEDIQIHTIDIRPNGTMNDVIQCAECENIFKNMYVTSQ
jgi:hypothetical protein